MRDTSGMDRMLIACFCLMLGFGGAVRAASPAVQGQPLIQRFTTDIHGAEPTSYKVLPLRDGRLLIGNSRGLLHYDGSHWDLLELPGRSAARSLFLGDDDVIYLGGVDQFGRLEADETGQLHFVDLRAEFGVDGERADFGIVWDIVGSSRGVFFRTDQRLFFLGYQGERETWPLGLEYRRMFVVDDIIYGRVHGRGFGRIEQGGLRLEPGGEAMAELPLAVVFPREDGLLLVGDDGFRLSSRSGMRVLPSPDAAALLRFTPNTALRLNDGSMLLGAHSGELLHFSASLTLLGVYPLGTHSLLDLASDREGGVWAATEHELLRIKLPSPWTAFTAREGLVGSPIDTAFHNGALWVATSNGVYRSELDEGVLRFRLAVPTSLEASSLLSIDEGLLVGDREGLLWHRGDGSPDVRVIETSAVYQLERSRFEPGVIYVVADLELLRLRVAPGGWEIAARWPLDGLSVAGLLEVSAGRIWMGNYRGAAERWDFDPDSGEILQRERFGAEHGIDVDAAFGTFLHRLGRQIMAVSGSRVFRLDGERFVEAAGEPFSLFEHPYEVAITETEVGDFAYNARKLLRRLPGTQDWQRMQLGTSMGQGFGSLKVDGDGKLRVVTWSGVLQYDPGVAEPPLVPLRMALAGWQLRDANGDSRRLPLRRTEAIALTGGDSLSFDFQMVSMEPGTELRFRIEGLPGGWSEWMPPTRPGLTLRNPGPGDYRLIVEGRTRQGRLAEPLDHRFVIAAQWWQTAAARFVALFLLALFLLLMAQMIARLRYRQFLALNRSLERRIAERTAELEQANRKLAELATEDSLTGVANRRALEQALNREWDRCGELRQPLAVIMIDVDHFKAFNDQHGHLEGDQQLVRVARELSAQIRPVRELLARFGGEEFAVILPGLGVDEAMSRAEQMRAAFDNERFQTTVSVGVCAEVPGPGRQAIDLLRDADLALYAAKRAGRNQVKQAA